MRRRLAIVIGIVLMVVVAVLWRCFDSSKQSAESAHRGKHPQNASHASRRPNPSSLLRGSIKGTVVDEAKKSVAGARVCAHGINDELDSELLREPACTATDERGNYELAQLLPATYSVGASARSFRPAQTKVALTSGRAVVGIDLQLHPGGVELTGVVLDVTGGPIANARVLVRGAITESDAQGRFSLWVDPGDTQVGTRAEGYADRDTWATPPCKIEVLMTPESTLAGVVVDAASNEPISGARVTTSMLGFAGWQNATPRDAFTDEQGRFRVSRLIPGRYTTVARTDRGYGRSETSTALGLGERAEGVVIRIHPAVRVEGRVLFASTRQPCESAKVTLSDKAKERSRSMFSAPSGELWAEGVLPGNYAAQIECDGALTKDTYDNVVINDRDITGLVWEVEHGASIEGRVATRSGKPVIGADVSAKTPASGASREGYGRTKTKFDGSYRITGLRAGSYQLYVRSMTAGGTNETPLVELSANAVAKKDMVLDEVGTVSGTVVDQNGKPVSRFSVQIGSVDESGSVGEGRTDMNGAFVVPGVSPGDYWVHEPWTHQRRTTVRANETATVKVIADMPTGKIFGVVTDHTGKPVTDAFIVSSWERDGKAGRFWRSLSEPDPVITNVDGAFTLTGLSDGTYSVLAYRKAGAEGVAEHVRIGDRIAIQLKPTAVIKGTVQRGGKPVDDFEITAVELGDDDEMDRFSQRERFFRTSGRFSIEGLPKHRYRVTASAEGNQAHIDLDLESGEARTANLDLDPLISITGRVVEHPSGKPVVGLRMYASRPGGSSSFTNPTDSRTDADGRFTIANAPRGTIEIRGFSMVDDDYNHIAVIKTVDGTGTVDVGTLKRVKRSWKLGDELLGLGFELEPIAPDAPAEQRALVVSRIDPAGAAAKTELKVGDVIIAIDGLDVTGSNTPQGIALLIGPPDSKSNLKLKRGVSIEIQR